MMNNTHRFLWIKDLPSTGRENVLVALVPCSFDHFAGMRLEITQCQCMNSTVSFPNMYLVLFNSRIIDKSNIFMHIKAEQRP